MNELRVRCVRLSKRYRSATGDVVALDDVSCAFRAGDVSVIAGPSGSGKSTLLRLIGGLDHPDEGDIEVAGVNLVSASGRMLRRLRRGVVGYLFQRPSDNFLPHLTVVDHLRLAQSDLGTSEHEALVRRLGIEGRLEHLPSELSGGEQQRAALAAVLAAGSRIVLADEPTAALDTASSQQLLDVVRSLAETGVAFVVASHDPLIRAVADVVVELDHGRVAQPHGRGVEPLERASSPLASRPRWAPAPAPLAEHAVPAPRITEPRDEDDGRPLVLRVDRVTKSYRRGEETVHAVRAASFELREAQFAGLFGRSGSGKTTLLNLVAGWERPEAGTVAVGGSAPAEPAWADVSVLPQKLGLFDELTVRGNIEYPARVAGRLDERREAVDRLVEALGLSEIQDRHPRETSVGEQQRCALARALVLAPRVVLVDEPTGHQDHEWGRAVFRTLERATIEGTACLAATHNEEILLYLDRVFAMTDGTLRERREAN